MKIALLFSGQYRPLNKELFQKSLNNLVEDINYSIFSFSWAETSRSLTYSENNDQIEKLPDIENIIQDIFSGFNLVNYEIESFEKFKDNLSDQYVNILNSKEFHPGTINSLPQIYAIYKSYKLLLPLISNYDLVFRCRFDSLFIHPLRIYDLEKLRETNNLYNINFGRAFNPCRVYDIFFGGSIKATYFLKDIWYELPRFVFNRYDNYLDKRDSCRLIYLAALNTNINAKSLNTRICDVYRMDKHLIYEKYIIKSHITRFTLNKSSFLIFLYLYKWFQYRKISYYYYLIWIFKSFLVLPIAFLKRFKYLKMQTK